MTSTSVNLLQRLREPNADAAWARFVDLYAPLIFYWARQKNLNVSDAADLVQDVLLTLIQKLPEFQYDPTRRFRGWLRTITVNRAEDFRRRMAQRPQSGVSGISQTVPFNDDSDLFVEAEYRIALVHRAMDLIRPEFREATWRAGWMLLVQGRSAADVAEELSLSLNAVYLAKSRILFRIREELDGLWE